MLVGGERVSTQISMLALGGERVSTQIIVLAHLGGQGFPSNKQLWYFDQGQMALNSVAERGVAVAGHRPRGRRAVWRARVGSFMRGSGLSSGGLGRAPAVCFGCLLFGLAS